MRNPISGSKRPGTFLLYHRQRTTIYDLALAAAFQSVTPFDPIAMTDRLLLKIDCGQGNTLVYACDAVKRIWWVAEKSAICVCKALAYRVGIAN